VDTPVTWFDVDLDRPETLAPALEGVEVVFHAAGYYPRSGDPTAVHVTRGVAQTRAVLQALEAAGNPRLVFTSTLTTVGKPPEGSGRLADERDHYLPASQPRLAYHECKYAMESEVLRGAASGADAVVVNPTAVFGPGDVHLTTSSALLAVAQGWGLVWFSAQVNVVDVRDVADAQLRAAEVGRKGERYILGGHNLPLREVMQRVAELTGRRPPQLEIPLWVLDLLAGLADHLPRVPLAGNHLRAARLWQGYNCAKAQRELGLLARPLEETLSDSLAWFRGQGRL
jgi:dihydroflavonol-4-reductase